ncbi:MAG: hypothetical protein MJ000_05875 [Bacteroidales bacterium]|nr:hypothetical protein [Bacteroidales bacterium]
MKKTLILLTIIILLGIFTTSCEKQCVCYNLTTGTSGIMYNAYSQSDCKDWEEIYKTDPHFNPDGHIIKCKYEKK